MCETRSSTFMNVKPSCPAGFADVRTTAEPANSQVYRPASRPCGIQIDAYTLGEHHLNRDRLSL